MAIRSNQVSGFIILFILVSIIVVLLRTQLAAIKIDYIVVLAANTLLFLLGMLSLGLHMKALRNPNPQAFVRSVMLANILKLFTLATAALIYILVNQKSASTNAIFVSLFLYIIYTWVEKRATIQLSKTKKD